MIQRYEATGILARSPPSDHLRSTILPLSSVAELDTAGHDEVSLFEGIIGQIKGAVHAAPPSAARHELDTFVVASAVHTLIEAVV